MLKQLIKHSPLLGIALVVGAVDNATAGISVALGIGIVFAFFEPRVGTAPLTIAPSPTARDAKPEAERAVA